MPKPKKPLILLIDDNIADIELTQAAFAETGLDANFETALDGEEAVKYLSNIGTGQKPDLIMLDLNMPRVDGRSILNVIKSDNSLRVIPVIIFTTSADNRDVTASYVLNANSYVIKPANFESLVKTITSIREFWLDTVMLPA